MDVIIEDKTRAPRRVTLLPHNSYRTIEAGEEYEAGVTESSREFVHDNIHRIGTPIAVIDCNRDDAIVSRLGTEIIGDKGILVAQGFATGYSGQGPSGLLSMLVENSIIDPSEKEKAWDAIQTKKTGCHVFYAKEFTKRIKEGHI